MQAGGDVLAGAEPSDRVPHAMLPSTTNSAPVMKEGELELKND
jgi:hypothetical protein